MELVRVELLKRSTRSHHSIRKWRSVIQPDIPIQPRRDDQELSRQLATLPVTPARAPVALSITFTTYPRFTTSAGAWMRGEIDWIPPACVDAELANTGHVGPAAAAEIEK